MYRVFVFIAVVIIGLGVIAGFLYGVIVAVPMMIIAIALLLVAIYQMLAKILETLQAANEIAQKDMQYSKAQFARVRDREQAERKRQGLTSE